jgi:5-methyltetrahydropteroyltriglutamate--homocysteine methyltransferase
MRDNRSQFRPKDHPYEHFLITTVVGSYPKPKWLQSVRESYRTKPDRNAHEKYLEAKRDASAIMIKEHENMGLDVISDGEMRRNEMIEYFAERIGGYEFNGPVKVWGHNYFDKPSVVENVTYGESWLTEEYKFNKKIAEKPIKVPITGPYTLANWSFNEFYEEEEELAYDLAKLVNKEIKNLVSAGVRYIQIDEPALATTPEDHRVVRECLDAITKNISKDVLIGLHVCYGDYSRIFPEIMDYPVDEFDVELANGNYNQLDVFKQVPFTKDIGFGVIDVHDSRIESVDEIKSRIAKGLEIVPPSRLTISPDCGMKLLPREVAYKKMQNMVIATRAIEEDLDSGTIESMAD